MVFLGGRLWGRGEETVGGMGEEGIGLKRMRKSRWISNVLW